MRAFEAKVRMKPAAVIVAVVAISLAVAAFGTERAMARSSLRSADQECADTAKAEVAISACTGLYENRGLGRGNRAIALGNRGAAYKLLGRYDDAIADFDRALELDPGNSQYYCQRGDVRRRTGADSEAVLDYPRRCSHRRSCCGAIADADRRTSRWAMRSRPSPTSTQRCVSSPTA